VTARALVCWEDRFHEKLDVCLRRTLRHLGLTSPALFFDDCRGNGSFVPYIERDWPKMVHRGLVKSGGPIDYLICVADADRAQDCCSVELPPQESSAAWVERANQSWTAVLRAAAPIAPERILGRFLRWNQESLLIAAHDIENAMKHLGCRDQSALIKHLRACNPSPFTTQDQLFVDHYRKPGKCLDDMLKGAGSAAPRKGAQPREDALEEASKQAIDRLSARVPDLAALADTISKLP